MRTGEKVVLGLTAAAATIVTIAYVSKRARDYRILEGRRETENLPGDYLARNAEPTPLYR